MSISPYVIRQISTCFSLLSTDFWAEGSQWNFIALSYEVWRFWHYLMCKSNCISQRLRLNSYHFKPMPWEYCIRFPHYFQPCRLYQELLLVHYNHKMKVVTFYKGQVCSKKLATSFCSVEGWAVPHSKPLCCLAALHAALLYVLGSKTCLENTKTFNKPNTTASVQYSLFTLHKLLHHSQTAHSTVPEERLCQSHGCSTLL